MSFGCFGKCFCKTSFAGLPLYKEAIFQVIEVRDKIKQNLNIFQQICLSLFIILDDNVGATISMLHVKIMHSSYNQKNPGI